MLASVLSAAPPVLNTIIVRVEIREEHGGGGEGRMEETKGKVGECITDLIYYVHKCQRPIHYIGYKNDNTRY